MKANMKHIISTVTKTQKGTGPIPKTKPSWPRVWSITHIFGKTMSNMLGQFQEDKKNDEIYQEACA